MVSPTNFHRYDLDWLASSPLRTRSRWQNKPPLPQPLHDAINDLFETFAALSPDADREAALRLRSNFKDRMRRSLEAEEIEAFK